MSDRLVDRPPPPSCLAEYMYIEKLQEKVNRAVNQACRLSKVDQLKKKKKLLIEFYVQVPSHMMTTLSHQIGRGY